jgi:CheY-like chemotaxis protein
MGGSISVTSTVGHGSTFLFTIRAKGAAPIKPSLPEVAGKHLRNQRVLVVDDNATSRACLAIHLQEWGMAVAATETLDEAVQHLDHDAPYDAVLLDATLPGRDGLSSALEIRTHTAGANIPLILFNYHAVRNDDTRIQESAPFATLPKPWKPAAIQRELLRALAGEGAAPSTKSQRLLDATTALDLPVKVLVVEDNPTNQQVVLTVLRVLGYQPDTVENGLDGVARATETDYGLILLDLNLPDIDGFEVARRVRAARPGPPPYIIAVTAGVSPEDRQNCFDAGMNDYVMKPFKISQLKEVIVKFARELRQATRA